MGWALLFGYPKFVSGKIGKSFSKTIEYRYRLDSAADVDAFLFAQKRKGGTVLSVSNGVKYYYAINDITVNREAPTTDGSIQIPVVVTLELLKKTNEILAPWELAPYNYRRSTEYVDVSTSGFYPGQGDLFFPNGSFAKAPFVNSAGVCLEGTTTQSMTRISFYYNMRLTDFDERVVNETQGKINNDVATICGMTFRPRTIQLESFDPEYQEDTATYQDANGDEITTTWKYYRINVSLLNNRFSFDKEYLNVGTHVLDEYGALARLWRWTNANGRQVFGTYAQYLTSGGTAGEEVSENMFLNAQGTGISEMGADGRQIPTFRVGSCFEPVSFNALNLPQGAPTSWAVRTTNE